MRYVSIDTETTGLDSLNDQVLSNSQYHEMIDRLYLISETIEKHLQQHPVAKIETTIGMLISDANDKLTTAYQLTNQIRNNKTNKNN